ncbi:hypothetical protein [Roseibium litorale]|uniref:Nucleotide modification associated domain-containing protein n=1 Tax=Roseibium litorale TaxID=2803841 RepID=A0ABR9CTY7_9HYPH|nr:hypothetical protein [Roseibium litorale]MBD8894307.1 hypothetical protein [Roseibium litorale]
MGEAKTIGTDDCIWLVYGHADPRNGRAWRAIETLDAGGKTPEHILKSMRQTKVGWFLPQDCFPRDLYPHPGFYPTPHKRRVPQIFSNGFVMLSGESAEVLRSFDIGEGALYPVRLWHPDRTTPMPGEFFYLSQGNRKDAFLPELFEGYKLISSLKPWKISLGQPEKPQLFFSTGALAGPDIWWDKSIYGDFFISNRLKKALSKRALARDWRLMRCSVVAD